MSPHKRLYTGAVIYENFSLQCLCHSSNRFDNGGFNESWSLMRVVARRVLTLTNCITLVLAFCATGDKGLQIASEKLSLRNLKLYKVCTS